MSHFKSLTQMQVRLIHIRIQVSPTGLERILQAWAGVPMWTMAVKNNVGSGKHALWEKAFRKAQTDQQDTRRSEDEQVKKHVVNRSAVWKLQNHTAPVKRVI
jgi:hypothetical protein